MDAPLFKPKTIIKENNEPILKNVSLMESLETISDEILFETTAEIY